MRPVLDICLAWHTFGHDNLGIDALARANAELLKKSADRIGICLRFVTLGSGLKPDAADLPELTRAGPAPSLRKMVKGDFSMFREICSTRLVIDIGEGDSFTDIYGRRRFLLQCATKLGAILSGRPLVLAPQTIGPFNSPLHARLATCIMNQAAMVCARDSLSHAFVNDLRVRAPCNEYIDVAFALPYTQAERTPERVSVGINVSGLLFNGGYTGQNELGLTLDYAELNRRLIQDLSERPGVDVYLFSHVSASGSADDDPSVIDRLAPEYPKLKAMPPFNSSMAAKSFMSGLDFVVAGRMHACIGAFSAGVPVVPVAYSRKFNGLFGTLRYPFYVDGKTSTTEAAVAKVLEWFDDRAKLAVAIEASRPVIAERLRRYGDDLVGILGAALKEEDRHGF